MVALTDDDEQWKCDHCGKPERFNVLCADCEQLVCTDCGRVVCCCDDKPVTRAEFIRITCGVQLTHTQEALLELAAASPTPLVLCMRPYSKRPGMTLVGVCPVCAGTACVCLHNPPP